MDPEHIGAFEAKTRLSELLENVSRGRTYRITRRGRVVAELRPATSGDARPTFGSDRDRIAIDDDFDAPLPDFKGYK